ncbi:hypothetical protein Goari_006820, partial [Gossypium aridum]|nr:hypothetical protein [Gossypium aridum]
MLHGTLCQMALIIKKFFKHFKNIKMMISMRMRICVKILTTTVKALWTVHSFLIPMPTI